jgi:transposase
LEKGTYRVPWSAEQGRVVVEAAELLLVLEGDRSARLGASRAVVATPSPRGSSAIGVMPYRTFVRSIFPYPSNSLFLVIALRQRGCRDERRRARRCRRSQVRSIRDLSAVRHFIEDMIARDAVVALVAAILALLVRMRDINTELMRKLAATRRKRPASETMRRLQLALPLILAPAANVTSAANDSATPPPVAPPDKPKPTRGPKKPHKHGRPKLPAHLTRVPEVLRVPEADRTCPHCGAQVASICFKVTAEKLDIEPAKYIVRQTQVETCACPKCRQHICTAPKPDEVIDRGILGNELLVQAMVDHYDDAVPFERMERNAKEQGVPLAANTLAASVGRLVDLFDPVVRHIREACLSSAYTALDATRMPVLDPTHPLGIKTGCLWLIEGDHRYACFIYAPTGHGDHLEAFLAGRTLGSVMCDGSATNNCVERAGGKRGGCNAHGRRKLVEALRGGDARAAEGLTIYGALFHVEAESKRLSESVEQRFARRLKDSVPLAGSLHAWVQSRRLEVEPKSKLGEALGYLHRQWKRLTAFLRDPLMEMTNNEVEGDFRRWVLDRQTWLFVGHDESAHRAAAALTLITTCKKFGIPARNYLRDTLAKILAGEKDLTALLPETYAAARAEAARAKAA